MGRVTVKSPCHLTFFLILPNTNVMKNRRHLQAFSIDFEVITVFLFIYK